MGPQDLCGRHPAVVGEVGQDAGYRSSRSPREFAAMGGSGYFDAGGRCLIRDLFPHYTQIAPANQIQPGSGGHMHRLRAFGWHGVRVGCPARSSSARRLHRHTA